MQLFELIKLINEALPPETAMDGDRLGLQIESTKLELSNLLIAFEMTDKVVEEAISINCDCIIVFHPLIFMPLKKINFSDRVGRITAKLIKSDIALISVHTTFDAYYEGTNKILADLLEVSIIRNLVPDSQHEGFGMGIIGEFASSISAKELLQRVYSKCNSPIKYTEGSSDSIKKIAIVGGSGSSFIQDVLANDVDAFMTADITYHTFHMLKGKIWLIDPGHYEMEQFVSKGIAKLLEIKLSNENLNIFISKTYTNPVRYFPDTDKYKRLQEELLNK